MNMYKDQIAAQIANRIEGTHADDIAGMLEIPPNPQMGDISLPCFKLSKTMRKAPQAIAEQIVSLFSTGELPIITESQAVSGYANFFLNKSQLAQDSLFAVLDSKDAYGSATTGEGQTIVIDYSSPNIAKPFHIGHLRSTVIGGALYRIFTTLGYQVVGVNHLGDWGTQFGKLIVAYQKWGEEAQIEADGVSELMRLYVKFHDEAEAHPELEDEARGWFVKLEQGDAEAHRLWKWFIEISLKEFNKIYDLLGVTFDSYAGESFYNDKMAPVLEELQSSKLLIEDDGALIVPLEEYGMSPALMVKKDGGTLYHTRDVAAAFYRKHTYNFAKCIYVTDYAQNLHFQQWFKIIELMGYKWAKDLVHVPFGRVSLEGVRLATRKGNVIKLEELLTQSIAKTLEIINSKNPNLPNKDEVARQVGVGAVIFNDLSMNRIKDISFSWDDALNFDGETGPYVQYTQARACSVLRKAADSDQSVDTIAEQLIDRNSFKPEWLTDEASQAVCKQIAFFPERVGQAADKLEPSIISRYLVDLAQAFNRFYHDCPILVDDKELRNARLILVDSVRRTLRNGLKLIGLEAPERI